MTYSTLAVPANIGIVIEGSDPSTAINIAENGEAGRIIGELVFEGFVADHSYSFSFVDPESGDAVEVPFEVVAGTGDDAGKFFFKLLDDATLDFEGEALPAFAIKVTDEDEVDGGTSAPQVITVTIDNVAEAPTAIVVGNGTTLAITENEDPIDLGAISHQDGIAGEYTYTLVATGDESNPSQWALGELFDIVDGHLVQLAPFDREAYPNGTFTFKIRAEIEGVAGTAFEQAITVTVANVNEAPTAIDFGTDGDVSAIVGTNASDDDVIATLRTIDPDVGDTHTYTIVADDGEDDAVEDSVFAIENGKLVVADPEALAMLDGAQQIWIKSTDAGGKSVWQQVTVNVQEPAEEENHAPTDISLSKAMIAENSAAGTEVGVLAAMDPDFGDSFTFSLSDNAGGAFKIENGKVVVADASKLDYEAATAHKIKVKVTDAGGFTFEKEFMINVTDVAESIGGAKKNDKLVGGIGADILDGKAGKDTLTGGLGKDAFVFSTKLGKSNVDKITDFKIGEDMIYLDNAIFKKLGKAGSMTNPAKLKKANFVLGSKAKDKNDYVGYDSKKGVLWYDSNGSADGGQQTIATLSKKLKMSFDHFFIV